MTEYQKIDFGDVKIDGKDRFPEYKLVFPEPPVNKVILDVGCNLGYYCFKAHMEGAKQCVGIDNHSAFIESANNTKKMNSIADGAVDFVLGDIATYPFGKFHYVLLLYVLHHFKDIKTVAGVISKCYALAKECLVIGILDWPRHETTYGWLVNNKNNKKIGFTIAFFEELFPKDKIESFSSAIVEDRSIIKIWKK